LLLRQPTHTHFATGTRRMNSLFLLLAFGATVVAGDIFKCDNGTGPVICAAHECCGVDGNCGGCPTNSSESISVTDWGRDRTYDPKHTATPSYNFITNQGMPKNLSYYDNISTWKTDLTKWKDWTEAAKSNKGLHWNIIMGSMYTKHIEKEQKTLERLSNDVKSQLNSMYLGKDSGCKKKDPSSAASCEWRKDPATCADGDEDGTPDEVCFWNGDQHENSPIQISMQDTKLAYEALVDCLKASVSDNYYPTYLDLVQKRSPTGTIATQVFHDQADFGEDKDLTPDSMTNNKTSDYLLLLKTKQAHYNLQSSYECSNEEMNFEVRLYKMSKLESRYKLLYLYCKCDLTSQIKKFKKMVQTICGDDTNNNFDTNGNFETGHCYSKTGTTQFSQGGSTSVSSTADHTDFVESIGHSECDIDDAFCPEHVFYYTNNGMNTHPAGDCSKCVDLGGDHSNATERGLSTPWGA